MEFESFRQDCLTAWNYYFNRIYQNLDKIQYEGDTIFPTHALFSNFGKYYGIELIGTSLQPTKLKAKNVKYDTLSNYFDLFQLGTNTPIMHYNDTGFHHHNCRHLSFGHPIDIEIAAKRFPLFGRHQSGMTRTGGNGGLMSFGDSFGGGSWIECTLTSHNNGFIRSKDILYFAAFPTSLSRNQLRATLEEELQTKPGENLICLRSTSGKETFSMSIAPLQNLYLAQGVNETTITDFLETHPEIVQKVLGARNTIYQPRLKWILESKKDKQDVLIPDLLWQREDGFYNILDFKLAKPNKFRLTKATHRRRRFVDYVNEGIAQLAHYAEYFEQETNKEYAVNKYDISVENPQLMLVIGNSENMHPDEVRESLRPLNKNIEIIDYDTFVSLYIQASRT